MGPTSLFSRIVLLLFMILTASCSSYKNYDRAYRRAWKKIVNSQAWRDALVSNSRERPGEQEILYTLPTAFENTDLEDAAALKVDEAFLDTYRSLVLRAYFRTIAEAEHADSRIYEAYNHLREKRQLKENRKNPEFKEQLEYAKNRYQAHREMLEGLKSWKAFNEYGSNDLDFFLREHLPKAYAMHREGKKDEDIMRYLVFRLADLYHFEERERE